MSYKAWGYVHSEDKRIHFKPFFSMADIEDALESPFCLKVSSVQNGETLQEAYGKVKSELEGFNV